MMFKLYDKQQMIVEEIKEVIDDPFHMAKGNMYLSGEMGSGKTYMGAEMANEMSQDYNVIVVSPKVNMNKWDSLLNNAVKLKKADSHNKLNSIELIAFEDLNMWSKEQQPIEENVFLVIDEIHLAINSKKQGLDNLLSLIKGVRKGLYLTGTIMEGEKSRISSIIRATHPHLDTKKMVEMMKSRFEIFVFKIWQHISVSVSLEDIQDLMENRQEIKQDIAPIEPIPLTREQVLFSNVIELQFKQADVGIKTIKSQVTSYIDNPSKELVYRTSSRASKSSLKTPKFIRLAMPLKQIEFKNTAKYKKLKSLIENSNDDRILVYVNEPLLIQELSNALQSDGITSFTIDNVEPENYSEYINTAFKSSRVGIVDPQKVNVGVDIHAEQLVWYQLMPILDKMIQAQRRVCRLSSENKSLVTIMVYDTKYESERANELSNATKQNAITYGVKQQDSLAQLTGILLEGID